MGKKKKLEKLQRKLEKINKEIETLKNKKKTPEKVFVKEYTGDLCDVDSNFFGLGGCRGRLYYLPSRGLPITKCEKCNNVHHLSTLD